MQISDEKIEKYIQIYFEIYGKKIGRDQAFSELLALVTFMNCTYKEINKKKKSRHKRK